MIGVSAKTFALYMRDLGLSLGKNPGVSKRKWDCEGFEKWKNVKETIPVVTTDVNGNTTLNPESDYKWTDKAPVGPKGESSPELFEGFKNRLVTPASGWLSFEDNDIYEIFEKIKPLIGRRNINATFTWEIAE